MEYIIHYAVRAWQERPDEVSWLCACGAFNKHIKFPVIFECVDSGKPIINQRVFRNVKSD